MSSDGGERHLPGLIVVADDIPVGCIGGGAPECNVLMPLWHYAADGKVPAAKTISVTVHSEGGRVVAPQMEHAAG